MKVVIDGKSVKEHCALCFLTIFYLEKRGEDEKMRKRMFVKKILALVLVATVFMTDIPAFAFDYEKMKEYGMEPITATHTAEDFTDPNCEEAYVVSEVTEKRESNIKHFRMNILAR